MRAPKLWRKRARDGSGRYSGSYHVTVKGKDVNLGTSDANEAEARRRLAMRGRRSFVDELDVAADAFEAPPPPQLGASSGPPGGAPPAPVVVPDAVIPPSAQPSAPAQLAAAPLPLSGDAGADARADAQATNDAAADAPRPANDNGIPPGFDPQVLDGLFDLIGHGIVGAQLELQARLIRWRWKREAGAVPADAAFREQAAKAWAAQLKIWIPSSVILPPWAVGVTLPLLLALTDQLPKSTPIRDPEVQPDAPAQAAA